MTFDDIVRKNAYQLMEILPLNDAMSDDGRQSWSIAWSSFDEYLEAIGAQVKNLDKLENRFQSVFMQAIRDWQELS